MNRLRLAAICVALLTGLELAAAMVPALHVAYAQSGSATTTSTAVASAGTGAQSEVAKPAKKRRRGKHIIYRILDILILSTPLTGFIAAVMFFDPDVRDRPSGLWTYSEEKADGIHLLPGYRRRVLTKVVVAYSMGTLAGLGLLTLLFHLLDLIPRIN